MKTLVSYPFYASLRFRFGLIFGFAFLCFLLIIGLLLYSNVKSQLEKSFAARLKTQANLILQETEINPITIPFPASGEYFSLIYDASQRHDTLFNNLPLTIKNAQNLIDAHWRSASLERNLETGGKIRIQYALPSSELENDIKSLQVILFLYVPLAFLAALVMGYFLSGFLLRPIENIVNKANDISLQGQIHLLEEPDVHDELHQLVVSLNRMLAQIRKQAQNQNAFFASASHELRTPLSIMLTELQTLQKDQIPQNIQPVITNQIAEVQRLGKLVNDFLLLSQLKSGGLILNKTNLNLADFTIEVLERFASRAINDLPIFKLNLTPEDGEFEIFTDNSLLTTILLNLLENAVKHGMDKSPVDIIIGSVDNLTTISIRNISKTEVTNTASLLQEFHKQNLHADGFGLGLWIVDRLCDSIGAKFEVHYEHPFFIARVDF